jgi:hypothetical protein
VASNGCAGGSNDGADARGRQGGDAAALGHAGAVACAPPSRLCAGDAGPGRTPRTLLASRCWSVPGARSQMMNSRLD